MRGLYSKLWTEIFLLLWPKRLSQSYMYMYRGTAGHFGLQTSSTHSECSSAQEGGGVVEVAWGGRGEVKYLTYDFFTKSHTLGHLKPTFEICLVKRFLLALDW